MIVVSVADFVLRDLRCSKRVLVIIFRLAEERNLRKKTENDLADAHRLLAEKEAQLQESRVTTTQQMNSHEDTKRDRENIASSLIKAQHEVESEQAARSNLETTVQQLRDKLKFDQELHEKVR